MPAIEIDLYSDTQSKPTPEMRKAMAEAEVGDEQQGTDPTVTKLCEMTAELLGKEEAVFLPSGTMCNQISVAVHCRPGDEVIAEGWTAPQIDSELAAVRYCITAMPGVTAGTGGDSGVSGFCGLNAGVDESTVALISSGGMSSQMVFGHAPVRAISLRKSAHAVHSCRVG